MPDLRPQISQWGTYGLMPDDGVGEIWWPRQIADNLGYVYSERRSLLSARLWIPASTATQKVFSWYISAKNDPTRSVPCSMYAHVGFWGTFRLRWYGVEFAHGTTDPNGASVGTTAVYEGLQMQNDDWGTLVGSWTCNASADRYLSIEVGFNYGSLIAGLY
jgi:hypothetical protein